jgi:gamma-glutamyl-gamma-aminobutyrate hydrolase PuuD
MFNKLLFFFLLCLSFSLNAQQNIGVLKGFGDKPAALKHNITEVLESFCANPVIIDYTTIVDWNSIKNIKPEDINEQTLKPEQIVEIDKVVYKTLDKFLRDNKIRKIVIGGDNYNYNEVPYHPAPQSRRFITKALAQMEKEGKIKLLGICGGMQGILYYDNIKLDSIKNMIGEEKAKKYISAEEYIMGEKYIETSSDGTSNKFYACDAKLNKLFIAENSHIGRLMITAEKEYDVKYERDKSGNLITYIPSAHHNGVSSFDKVNLEKLDKDGFKVIGKSEDGIVYVTEMDKSYDIMIEGHPELLANVTKCKNSFPRGSVIFSRLLFWDLINGHLKDKLPKNLLGCFSWGKY